MKIKLLLDVHVPPEVAAALRGQFPGLDVQSIHENDWAALADEVLLELLDPKARVLVTRDVNTVPLHCKARLAAGKTFAGVIYADRKLLRQTDRRGIIRRLAEVVEKYGNEDFNCRSGWLRAGAGGGPRAYSLLPLPRFGSGSVRGLSNSCGFDRVGNMGWCGAEAPRLAAEAYLAAGPRAG